VGVQIRFLVESLVAPWVRADERLLACVDAHVRLQVEIEGEPLVADVTLVWLLSRVNQHVSF